MNATASRIATSIATLAFATLCALPVAAGAGPREDKQADVRETAQATLERLYKAQPAARGVIEKSAGYAVFSNFGMKLFVAGGGKGSGVAVNNKTQKETFMRMVEVQAGLGFGVKKFRLVWVFETQGKLNEFINKGWELGAQATASAQVSGQGTELYAGAMSISPGIWLYQLTDDGLALELTAKGTKYYVDRSLN